MAAETVELRGKARRVKDLTLAKAIKVLEDEDHTIYPKEMYELTYSTALKNAIPRTQEITGEDGGAILITSEEQLLANQALLGLHATDTEDIKSGDTITAESSIPV